MLFRSGIFIFENRAPSLYLRIFVICETEVTLAGGQEIRPSFIRGTFYQFLGLLFLGAIAHLSFFMPYHMLAHGDVFAAHLKRGLAPEAAAIGYK